MKSIKSIVLLPIITLILSGCDIELEDVYKKKEAMDNVLSSPTSVFDIKYKEMLQQDPTIADTIVVTINKDLNIVDADNKKISSFNSYYEDIDLKKNAFCVRIEDTETADNFIKKYKNNYLVQDLIVMSKSKDIVQKFKSSTGIPYFGAAYDVSNLETLDYDQERMVANSIGAGILVISQSQINNSKIRYTQNMAKCVWTYCDESSDADYYSCLASGAFGIISEDMNAYNRVYNKFADFSKKVMLRSQFNIAHRGDNHHFSENTIVACESAILSGAEALELDFHLTKDGSLVVMHDKTTYKTCDKDVTINEATDEEIRAIKVIKGFGGEDLDPQPIPFFEDVAALMEKYPDVILYAEIKSSDAPFPKKLIDEIAKYGLENRVVIIYFESLPHPMSDIPLAYSDCHKLNPNIWGLDLMWTAITDLTSLQFKNEHNAGYDCNLTTGLIIHDDYLKYMKYRGFLPTYWTLIDTEEDIKTFFEDDIYAMTNNYPCLYKDYIKTIGFDGVVESKEIGTEYKLNAKTYGGEEKDVTGKVLCYDDDDLIFSITTDDYSYVVRAGI